MMISQRCTWVSKPNVSRPRLAPLARPARPVGCRAAGVPELLAVVAEAGDVDAPIGVVIGAAVLIGIVGTAIIPLALKPGQEAFNEQTERLKDLAAQEEKGGKPSLKKNLKK